MRVCIPEGKDRFAPRRYRSDIVQTADIELSLGCRVALPSGMPAFPWTSIRQVCGNDIDCPNKASTRGRAVVLVKRYAKPKAEEVLCMM